MIDLNKKYGPMMLWQWGAAIPAAWLAYQYMFITRHAKATSNTAYGPVPPVIIGNWFPGYSEYIPPIVTPIATANDSPTPGAQGGAWRPGFGPSVLPPVFAFGGHLIDPTTGLPIYSGTNGEGGSPWNPGDPIKAGHQVHQMKDGRWAQFKPGQNIQNGNRVSLGLPPSDQYTSQAPGANPVSIAVLLGVGARDYG